MSTVISSLIITVTETVDQQELKRRLEADGRFTIGERAGRRWALVSEDADKHAAEDTFTWLRDQCDGVHFVELVGYRLDVDQ